MTDRSDICKRCRNPIATQEDWDNIPEGEGEYLCWGDSFCSNDAEYIKRLEAEQDRLRALLMAAVTQSREDKDGKLHHHFMSAWESAFEYLENVGLMDGVEMKGFELTVDPWAELDRTYGWDQ